MVRTAKKTENVDAATRERLLDTAEKLFAENGFEAVSIRDITSAAGCSNVAAINYYFGSKDKLYEACLLGLFRDLREWRTERISSYMAEFAGSPSLEEFLRGFVQGFLNELDDEERRQRLSSFIDQEIRSARLHPTTFNDELVQPIRDLTSTYLSKNAPGLDQQSIDLFIEFFMGHLVHVRRLHDQLRSGYTNVLSRVDESEVVTKIVTYAAGGIRACAARSSEGACGSERA